MTNDAAKALERISAYIRGNGHEFLSKTNNPNHDVEIIRQALSNPCPDKCCMVKINAEQGEVIRGLAKALEPFAALADDVDKFRHEDESTCDHKIKAGDLRKARAALQKFRRE